MTRLTRLYGLNISSELPLHQQREAPPDAVADISIVVGQPVPRTEEQPHGRVMLDLQADRQYYTVAEQADGYLMRFYSTCDVRLDRDLTTATVHLFPGADPGIAAVLAGGTVLAFVLAMRQEVVLHASAVQVGEVAMAFVGASGMGKSTMAALLCAEGARLITDDLLRLDPLGDDLTCALGATELRLRKSASELSARFEDAPGRRTTGDARDALAARSATTEGLPLRAIVVPGPDHSGTRVHAQVDRLDAMTAFLLLSRFPRLLGWQDEAVLRRQFQQLGEVIDAVPVFVARLPWGPPFPDSLTSHLREAVGV